jgi:hypothetical protein
VGGRYSGDVSVKSKEMGDGSEKTLELNMRIFFIAVHLSIFFTLVQLCGCSGETDSVTNLPDSIAVPDSVEKTIEAPIDTSEFHMEIPKGFSLDTIVYFDSLKIADIDILLPLSGIKELDDRIAEEANKRKTEFLKNLDLTYDPKEADPMHSWFDMSVNSIYESETIISYRFCVGIYDSYAAHPLCDFYSYNYNRKTGKEITFQNYFDVQEPSDTSLILNLINTGIGMPEVQCNEIKNIDFNVRRDTISFNFDDYEISDYAHGMIEAPVDKKQLISLIRIQYR